VKEKEKKEVVEAKEEKKAAPKAEVKAPEKKGPPTIAESEVAEHREAANGNRGKEIARRMQIDPDKSQAEIEKEYDKQLAEQAKIDKGQPTNVAHAKGPGKSTDSL